VLATYVLVPLVLHTTSSVGKNVDHHSLPLVNPYCKRTISQCIGRFGYLCPNLVRVCNGDMPVQGIWLSLQIQLWCGAEEAWPRLSFDPNNVKDWDPTGASIDESMAYVRERVSVGITNHNGDGCAGISSKKGVITPVRSTSNC